jgi:hypothetical protein
MTPTAVMQGQAKSFHSGMNWDHKPLEKAKQILSMKFISYLLNRLQIILETTLSFIRP